MKDFDVFVSYSHRDKEWARRFVNALKRQGVKTWLDEEHLKPGSDWRSGILRALERSQHVVTVLDPMDINRASTYFEVGMAIGLGKSVTFVVPESKSGQANVRFDVKKRNVLKRQEPEVTAQELLTAVRRVS